MTEWVPTTCMRCAVGCGHLQRGVDVGHGVDTVRGDGAHPVSRGLACRRGTTESADPGGEWLTRPLVRRGGELVPTTWDVALARVGETFRDVVARDPDGLAVLGSGQQTNEAAYALGKLARGGIGTRHYDANTTLCMASAVRAYYDAFGSDAPPPTYDDVPTAETHVVWGANPAVAHPVLFRWIHDSATGTEVVETDDGGSDTGDFDGRLIVVDPVATETAEHADRHVRPDPGGDLALARAALACVVERGGVDRGFVDAHTSGFELLCERLPAPADAAAAAGVPLADAEAIAAALDAPTLVYWGMGVNQSVNGTATARALVDLCLATGNLGPGTGPFSLTGQANSMGTRVCASKGTWPGHRAFDDPDERRVVADAWGVPVDRLPDDAGAGPVGIVDAIGDEVEAVWTVATNPAAGLPDAARATERLEEAFLVVQDAFRTETAELADVVLPAATWGESEGTVMNMERTVSRVRAATDTPPGIRQDLDVIAAIGAAVAPGVLDRPPLDPAAVFDEFAALTAGTNADCSGIDYDRLDAEYAVRWPAPDAATAGGYRYFEPDAGEADANHAGEADANHAGEADGIEFDTATVRWSFPTPDGRAHFGSRVSGDLPEPTDDDYPLTLTTARTPDAYNTGVRSRDPAGPPPVARVHPATVEAHTPAAAIAGDGQDDASSDDHCEMLVASRRGTVRVRVATDLGVPEGTVWLPIHHPMTNHLTLSDTDPLSDEPNYKQCAVRLAPVSGDDDSDAVLPLAEVV